MKSEKLYDHWNEQRSHIEVGQNFTDQVMNQVYQYEQKRKTSSFNIQWFVEAITAHPLVQAAMVAVGAIVGFIRLAIMLHILLYT